MTKAMAATLITRLITASAVSSLLTRIRFSGQRSQPQSSLRVGEEVGRQHMTVTIR